MLYIYSNWLLHPFLFDAHKIRLWKSITTDLQQSKNLHGLPIQHHTLSMQLNISWFFLDFSLILKNTLIDEKADVVYATRSSVYMSWMKMMTFMIRLKHTHTQFLGKKASFSSWLHAYSVLRLQRKADFSDLSNWTSKPWLAEVLIKCPTTPVTCCLWFRLTHLMNSSSLITHSFSPNNQKEIWLDIWTVFVCLNSHAKSVTCWMCHKPSA